MITEIKRGLKLIQYGYGLKMNLFGGALFIIIGIVTLCSSNIQGTVIGILLLVLGPYMVVGVQYSLLYSNIVASSSKKRLMEIVIPDLMNIIIALYGLIALVAATSIKSKNTPEQADYYIEMMLIVSFGIALIMSLYGACYKYYWLSFILFFLAYYVIYFTGEVFVIEFDFHLDIVNASLISMLIVAAGMLLAGVLRRLLYKKALSPMACGANLRKAMQ